MDLGLKGRRAFVLGASRGLGKAIALTLAAEGANVVIAGREAGRTSAVAEEIRGRGGNAETLLFDLSDRTSTNAALAGLGDVAIDILVNNSGGPPPGPIADTGSEVWRRQFEAMVDSLFAVTARFLPGMRQRRFGRIVNIVSSGVVQPIPNLGISNALRAAIVGWAKTLAGEVAADGVTVNSVLPGRISTDRVAELDAAAAQRSGKTVAEVAAQARANIPAGRYGEPREFADVVAFLASERASYVTGSLIRVDGGMIRSV